MSKTFAETDRQTWGWWTAGLLFLALGSPAWALDLESSIRQQEGESSQLVASLGRDKSPNQMTSKQTGKTVQVQLIRKSRTRELVVR